MRVHALLAPSSASRWLVCTPSARIEENYPDTTSIYADEGTLAHKLGELLIKYRLGMVGDLVYLKELEKSQADQLYGPAMWDHCENYAMYVIERYNAALAKDKNAKIYIEQRVNLTDYIPEGFGSVDVYIIATHILEVIDLKYGAGVPVYATGNKQAMIYALGALKKVELLYEVDQVLITIYQPRIDNISTFEIATAGLEAWALRELKPQAEKAFKGEGELVAGDHCRFCKAKATCRANADLNMEIAKYDFKGIAQLQDGEIADILRRADNFIKWVQGIQAYAFDKALNEGKKWDGWKLVEGRSNRCYKDEVAVGELLIEKGYQDNDLYTKKLIGITAMEKFLTKKVFDNILTDKHVIKPAGSPTLVLEGDKRPEINSLAKAERDFADILWKQQKR